MNMEIMTIKKQILFYLKKLSEVENCVIPGFYGSCSEDPTKIRTFSRGGSDVTGSIVAKCGQVKTL